MNNTSAHTTIHNPCGIAGVRSSTIHVHIYIYKCIILYFIILYYIILYIIYVSYYILFYIYVIYKYNIIFIYTILYYIILNIYIYIYSPNTVTSWWFPYVGHLRPQSFIAHLHHHGRFWDTQDRALPPVMEAWWLACSSARVPKRSQRWLTWNMLNAKFLD